MSETQATAKAPEKQRLRVGFLIHDVSRLRRTVYDQRLKPLGITRSQWWVLVNLGRHADERGMLQIELARQLDLGKVTVGGLIDRLEASGFVQRLPDESDRRSKRVVISAQGRELLEQIQAVAREINSKIMKGISREEEALLIDILARMKHNLIDMEALPNSTRSRSTPKGDSEAASND